MKNPSKKNFFRRHVGFTVFASIALTVALAASITLSVLYNCVFTVPLEYKADRVSEGIVPTEEDLLRSPKYEHVVIFGVDGAGGAFEWVDTPNFDRIFSHGSINYDGVAEYPTISAQNWGSMFTGVTAQKHQLTNEKASMFLKIFDSYPTFFKIHSDSDRSASAYVAANWIPINLGLIEPAIWQMKKESCYFSTPGDKNDDAVDLRVKECVLERLEKQTDNLVYMHFDGVDEAGHARGGHSQRYAEAIQTIDGYMGEIYDAYVKKGIAKDTLFLCVSDHGHTLHGGHGGEEEEVKRVTLAAYGGKGDIIQGTCGKYVCHDLASIVLYALGDRQPDHFEGGVPKNLFSELPGA